MEQIISENNSKSVSPQCIRELRLRMGWSSSDLAKKLNITQDEVAMLESGKANPTKSIKSEIEILLSHAELCAQEILTAPQLEQVLDEGVVDQLNLSKFRELIVE